MLVAAAVTIGVTPAAAAAGAGTAAPTPTAVGSYATGNIDAPQGATLVESWNGTAWQQVDSPTPAGSGGWLNAVSCTTADACTAVGAYIDTNGVEHALAEQSNGSGWTAEFPPDPVGATVVQLVGVSCTAATCTAVGQYTADNTPRSFVETLTATGWTLHLVGTPDHGKGVTLYGVSCPSAGSCLLVGSVEHASGPASVAEVFNGTSFTLASLPTPSGSHSSTLYGVSCATGEWCMAVGSSQSSTASVPLAEFFNGTAWRLRPTPALKAAADGVLSAVSCPVAGTCAAVGSDESRTSPPRVTLAERFAHGSWAVESTPATPDQTSASLDSVSCSSAEACFAVGSDYQIVNQQSLLAESWDGQRWAADPAAAPNGFSAGFSGVSS